MPAFGAATNLVGGTLTLTLPLGARYWYLQVQDADEMKVAFTGGAGAFGPITLNAATVTGAAGDWLDSIGFPWFGSSVTITSGTATLQFGSGYSMVDPITSYTKPASPW